MLFANVVMSSVTIWKRLRIDLRNRIDLNSFVDCNELDHNFADCFENRRNFDVVVDIDYCKHYSDLNNETDMKIADKKADYFDLSDCYYK